MFQKLYVKSVCILYAVMGHFICGRQTRGHQNHGPQRMDSSRLIYSLLFLSMIVLRSFRPAPASWVSFFRLLISRYQNIESCCGSFISSYMLFDSESRWMQYFSVRFFLDKHVHCACEMFAFHFKHSCNFLGQIFIDDFSCSKPRYSHHEQCLQLASWLI